MKMLWLNLLCTLLYFRSIFCAAFSSQICVTTTIYCLLGKKSIIRHHRCNKKKVCGDLPELLFMYIKILFLHADVPGSIEDNFFQHILHTDIVA